MGIWRHCQWEIGKGGSQRCAPYLELGKPWMELYPASGIGIKQQSGPWLLLFRGRR